MLNFRSKIKNSSGTTLIEVIIAMFVMSVLVVLYVAALNTVTLSKKLRRADIAYHIASKQMEDLRNTPYDSLAASGSITDTMLTQLPSSSGSYTVTDYPSYVGMKEMVVTVAWNDGLARSVVIRSLVGTQGINP